MKSQLENRRVNKPLLWLVYKPVYLLNVLVSYAAYPCNDYHPILAGVGAVTSIHYVYVTIINLRSQNFYSTGHSIPYVYVTWCYFTILKLGNFFPFFKLSNVAI